MHLSSEIIFCYTIQAERTRCFIFKETKHLKFFYRHSILENFKIRCFYFLFLLFANLYLSSSQKIFKDLSPSSSTKITSNIWTDSTRFKNNMLVNVCFNGLFFFFFFGHINLSNTRLAQNHSILIVFDIDRSYCLVLALNAPKWSFEMLNLVKNWPSRRPRAQIIIIRRECRTICKNNHEI